MRGNSLRLSAALALAALISVPGLAAPGSAKEALGAARAALSRGDGIAAQAELNKALAAGADRAEVAAAMGEALLIQGKTDRAREWLEPGQFATGDEAYGWRMLGLLERGQGNFPAAGRAYDRALTAGPKDPLIWVDIGRLRYIGGEQLQAIDAADRALQAGPDNVRALEFRAQLLRDQAGWEAALPYYERALQHAPDDLALLGGYAETLGELGRARDMLAITRKMIELAPKHPQAWFLQAVLAARAGKVDLARSLLGRTGERLGELPAAMLLRGLLELEAGNANVAVATFERLSLSQPANPRLQLLLARALYEAGDHDGLFARFRPVADRADASPYLLALLGRAFEERGDRAAAATYLDRAAARARACGHADCRVVPGQPGRFAPLWDRAILPEHDRSLIASLQQKPGSAEALSLAGDAALAQGAAGQALERYGLAARVRFPDRMLLRMVEALERSGQGPRAPDLAAGYLRAFPGSRLTARLAAGHAAYAGNWAHARSLLESLRQRAGNRDARLLVDLSFAQLRAGDPEMAAETAERAARLQPGSGVAAQAWALALVELDRDPALAVQLLHKARAIDGDNPLLAEARKKLGNAG